jgi:hypothetical protein
MSKVALENIFLFLTAKSKNKKFLSKSNIKLPAYVHSIGEKTSIGNTLEAFQA